MSVIRRRLISSARSGGKVWRERWDGHGSNQAAPGRHHYTEILREQYLPSGYSSVMISVIPDLKRQNVLEYSKEMGNKQGHEPGWLLLCRLRKSILEINLSG